VPPSTSADAKGLLKSARCHATFAGRGRGELEGVTARLWAGAAVIVLGTTVLLWVQPVLLPHAP
jgi:hypothetical protein